MRFYRLYKLLISSHFFYCINILYNTIHICLIILFFCFISIRFISSRCCFYLTFCLILNYNCLILNKIINLTSSANSIDFDLIVFVYQIKNYKTLIKFDLFRSTSKKINILLDSIINRFQRLTQARFVKFNTRDKPKFESIEFVIFFEN